LLGVGNLGSEDTATAATCRRRTGRHVINVALASESGFVFDRCRESGVEILKGLQWVARYGQPS